MPTSNSSGDTNIPNPRNTTKDLYVWSKTSIVSSRTGESLDDILTNMSTAMEEKSPIVHNHTVSQITDFPTALKNPNALTLQLNGVNNQTYDGSSAVTYNVTPANIGAAAASHGTHVSYGTTTTALTSGGTGVIGSAATVSRSDHTHTLPAYPTALKNPTSMVVQLNGGSAEGTDKFTYDGSAGKTLNVTAISIGAAPTDHGTHVSYGTISPKALGTATPGTSTKVSREDHVHPLQTEITGNSETATKWKTARKITLTGHASGNVSLDGSQDVSLALTVADNSHAHTIANVTNLQTELNNKSNTDHTHGNISRTNMTESNVNLNDYITTFNGVCKDDAIASTYTNCPSPKAFVLDVDIITDGDQKVIKQRLQSSDQYTYERFFTNGAFTSWTVVNKFSSTPVSGQVMISDGTLGKVKTSGFTIAKSVPADAKFTDTIYVQEPLTVSLNGVSQGAYDGSTAKAFNITPSSIGAAATSHGTHVTYGTATTALTSGGTGVIGTSTEVSRADHTHTLPAYPTALKNPTALTIQCNGATKATYDGAEAKIVNITPSSIGAAPTDHGTHVSYGTTTTALTSGGTGVVGSAATLSRSDHTHTLPAYPTALKNPTALSVKVGTSATSSYDGSAATSIVITPDTIGAAESSHGVHVTYGTVATALTSGGTGVTGTAVSVSRSDHTHTLPAYPTALKNPTALNISLNGTSQGAYDGSAAKSFDITAASVGAAASSHTHVSNDIVSLDSSKLVGVIDIDLIPKGALERCIVVKDDAARFALTTNDAQNGDTIKVSDTGFMYFVKDQTKLNTEDGYEIYTAGSASSVAWAGVTGKPSTFPPSTHSHTKSQITDFPDSIKNPTALTLSINGGTTEGTDKFTYDGSAAKAFNITPSTIGAAIDSHTHTKSQITDFPTALKNPTALAIQLGTAAATSYDGSAAKSIVVNPENIGAAAASHGTHVSYGTTTTALTSGGTGVIGSAATLSRSDHTHTLPAYPTELKNPTALTITLNGGSVEGTSKSTYDGSAVKSLNITASLIGAAATSHGTHVTYGTTVTALTSGGTGVVGTSADVSRADHTHTLPAYPTALKSPNTLTIFLNGTSQGAYDGSAVKSFDITPSAIGAAAASHGTHVTYGTTTTALTSGGTGVVGTAATLSRSDHTHTLPAYPTTLPNPTGFTLQLNGTSQGAWDGSTAKTVNVTAASVGAAVSSHTHDDRYYTETEVDSKLIAKANGSASSITITGATGADWYRIATSPISINDCIGTFTIVCDGNSNHSTTILQSSISFGMDANIIQLTHSCFSKTTPGISQARIVYNSNYSEKYAYLEVYVPNATSRTLNISLSDSSNWTLLSTKTQGGIPAEYKSKEITLVPGKIVADFGGQMEGNADSATKLLTARKIGNASFDGTADITVAQIGAAATSHGNHVPTIQTANNTIFLRNDNTWQTITPANIGAAPASHGTHVTYGDSTSALVSGGTGVAGTSANVSRADHTHTLPAYPSALKCPTALTLQLNGGASEGSNKFTFDGSAAKTFNVTPANIGAAEVSHGTHVTYGTATPKVAGTAIPGTSTSVSREDHVHPEQASVSGNAGTATKLQTARYIGSAQFDGSANITLATMGAAATGHTHTMSNITDYVSMVSNLIHPVGSIAYSTLSSFNPATQYGFTWESLGIMNTYTYNSDDGTQTNVPLYMWKRTK